VAIENVANGTALGNVAKVIFFEKEKNKKLCDGLSSASG